MTLLKFDQVSLEFGDIMLLSHADFTIDVNERVCLIGRNGAGKSSLLKLITGAYQPDHGRIEYKSGLRVSTLRQELSGASEQTCREIVAEGVADRQRLIDRFHQLSAIDLDGSSIKELEQLQLQIETTGGWNVQQQVDRVISELEIPAEQKMKELSGGWRRRVALGRALVSEPDLLLLDEPTNHLDISTIEWLEHEVRGYQGSVLFITHDRRFLQKLATRIIELENGRLVSWPGNYSNFLRRKEALVKDQERAHQLFDKKLAEEETWIRQGIKARRTRNEGRVRSLIKMREERAKRHKRQGKAKIEIAEGDLSGRKVIEARNLSHSFADTPLIKNLSLKIIRGDRIGLIGNNGVGKSTLLRILLGQLKPTQGNLKLGTNLEVAYFDQLRQELDDESTIAEAVGGGREYIDINGKQRHVISYLRDFLFSPKRAVEKIKVLSGGERNRVILAQLFTRPANLLVLDEPTNDLDVEMLEALEQRLVEYQGTLIVVSHDREFLDAVVTSVLVFEEEGRIQEYVGGFSDWEKRGRALAETDTLDVNVTDKRAKNNNSSVRPTRKLSYKLQRELDALPDEIERLELELAAAQQATTAPEFYQQDQTTISEKLAELKSTQGQLDMAIERWGELESQQQMLSHSE